MAATAAINGVGFCSFSDNLSTMKLIKRRSNGIIIGARSSSSRREVGTVLGCLSPSKAVAPLESEGDADEVVFEAIVKDSNSPLYNIKVVLRKLVSTQAKRRGMRAMEVLKKLVRRKLMYHSYSMQFHGYISSPSSGRGSFTLAHWVCSVSVTPLLEIFCFYWTNLHFSACCVWMQFFPCFNFSIYWLPTLEANLALDEESVRRVGDDTVGGPAVSRQLRITCILMRDLLIGELLAKSWTFGYRVEAGECAYKPRG
ncbi:hypothetical protein NC651_033229 [Populus alba x Populus x berolinensis]|nr:hypothetical protein NC651_033229 [Populus alba x Populus x berolinensis]